ncbi:hypothetical protein K435DRAFT_829411 [Dendrothele bispora CBS 962.96]|uniref:Nucleoporin n=1 Tax=Dendrothele bispora (strain CBS 962.96) TaxID=1314807 RepID=A0A4S8LW34_DENBC|nr:hypothetical protein K435DRAFT_829411 [Dendrothele bispora CBS 962.96]
MSRLRSTLVGVLNLRGQQGEQELFDELMVHKTRLLNVLDMGNRDSQQQKELESGKTTVNGKSVAVNAEFARQAIFLSQQLECSERYIAEVLHSVQSQNPNIDPVGCLESTVYEFHQRRRDLVDCLIYLLEACDASEHEGVYPIVQRIESFVREELIIPVPLPGGGEIPLAYRIFKQIEAMGGMIQRADNARKSARSNSIIPPVNQGPPSLGSDILTSRYESRVLYLMARCGYLSPNEIKHFTEWLSVNPNHGLTYHMLTTLLSALDPVDPESNDSTIINFMTKKLDPLTEWKEPGLKATVLLKWTLFLTEHRHRNPNVENRSGFRTEELEVQIWNAVQGDVFTYLSGAVLQLYRRQSTLTVPSLLSNLTLTSEQLEQREVPEEDFKPDVLTAFESLIRSLITHASSELRKIKQRQEDLVHANIRTDRSRGSDKQPRNDIAMLYSFIAPETALQFWGSGGQTDSRATYLEVLESTAGRLPTFLQWAVWSTQAHDATIMSMALYDMLAGLATGQQCSELAYNFMARGRGEVIPGTTLSSSSSGSSSVSWDVIFGTLDAWSTGTTARAQGQPQGLGNSGFGGQSFSSTPQQQNHINIGPNDVLRAQSYLRLLSTVVTHSIAVRLALSNHAHFRAIPTLVSLIPLSVPLELKGMIFETLASFCQPGAGIPGVEICRAVWTCMERMEVINVRASSNAGFGDSFRPVKGVEVEFEEIEALHGLYPATIPFLKLLSTLIHTPKRIPLKDRVTDASPINTTPETLGQPYRLPGIGPFVSFVIDNVFSKISSREYLRPSQRWEMNDLCLSFIERVLASYDLESLLTAAEGGDLKAASIAPFLVHPGYDVMKRILTNTNLQAILLSYVVEGLGGFEKGFAAEEPYFESTILRVLRIVLRVLEIQDIFLDILIPLISDFDSAPLIGTIYPRSYFTKFDQALSFGAQFVPAVAAYVTFPAFHEVVFLSVKIITILSSSSTFANLATLIERSDDSERILAGYLRIMSVESFDDVSLAEASAEQTTGAGAPDPNEGTPSPQATRLAVLDLLIQNTEANVPYPSIAHFLLFGSTNQEQGIQDPHALGAKRACIHIILDLINAGVPRLKNKGKERYHDIQNLPLFASLPELAERCYHVVYKLCVHPRSSTFTMRYLRTREDFFARHLAAVPSIAPGADMDAQDGESESLIQVLYGDGSRVPTTIPTLSSFLRLRSWIFDLVALDLHVLTRKGHHRAVSELLEILFNNESTLDESPWEDDISKPFREVGQSHLRVIEFVQSLTFEWEDSLVVEPMEIQLLSQLNLQSCVRKDSSGCEIVDRSILLSLLTTARQSLFAQNKIVTQVQSNQLDAETNYILRSCAVENNRRQVMYAVASGFEAWRRMLDTTLMKCFEDLPHDHRENMLFDLLHVLPPITKSAEIQESTAVLISEVILSSITKLREDRRHQIILQSAGGDSESGTLPAERLFAILRNILECIMDNRRVELVRGNLYASLINYVHFISPSQVTSPVQTGENLSLSLRPPREGSPFSESLSLISHNALGSFYSTASQLQLNSLALMKDGLERLVITISRDAIDGTEVWRTVAFMLLDSLVQLSAMEKSHPVLTHLVRHGILANFVQGLKESDFLLQAVLKPDPDDLNPLYVYESKMSFLIRAAQTRIGAERLLEARLIPTLAQCDFLDTRPEADSSFVDHDTFLASAVQRYHQLFMPSLQVVNSMLATLGSKHATVCHQALDFLSTHSATIVILLKNETGDLSLALVEEIHLLVVLCAKVLPLVPQAEMASTHSGFGAINTAILSLCTRFLSGGTWIEQIRPQTDEEIRSASAPTSGFGSETKFDLDVRRRERLLRKALITYAGATSNFTESSINLVLSPIPTRSRREEHGTHFLATIPTIGDAVEALTTLCNDLSGTLKQISDISAELGAKEHMAVDRVQEIVVEADIDFVQSLEIGQKRNLICRELERIRQRVEGDAKMVMVTIEMLLLLLWRHLSYYAEGHNLQDPQLSSSTATAMRFLSNPDPQAFNLEVRKRLNPTLQRLQSLALDESLNDDWRSNQAYVEIMCRRVKDSAGLHDSGDTSEEIS